MNKPNDHEQNLAKRKERKESLWFFCVGGSEAENSKTFPSTNGYNFNNDMDSSVSVQVIYILCTHTLTQLECKKSLSLSLSLSLS